MAFTNSDAQAVLNAGRGTAYPAWTPYLAAFTADPTAAGTLTAELSGGGYARPAVTLAAPTGKATSNSAQLTFSATAGTVITHIGLADAATAGTLRRFVPVNGGSVTVGSSGQVTVAIGQLTDTFA